MKKMYNRWVLIVGTLAASGGAAMAQTNTITGVTTEMTTGLGTALDVGIGIGVIATGIGLVVYLIKKGVKLRA